MVLDIKLNIALKKFKILILDTNFKYLISQLRENMDKIKLYENDTCKVWENIPAWGLIETSSPARVTLPGK